MKKMLAKIFVLFALVFLWSSSAISQLPGTFMPVMGSETPKILTYIGTQPASGQSATITYTSASIGTPSSDRYVVVGVVGQDNANSTVSSVTVCGNAATLAKEQTNTRSDTAIFIILDTSNTSCNIVATFSSSKDNRWLIVWTITGISSATPVGTAGQTVNNTSTSLTTVNGGVAVGVCGSYGGGSAAAWTNLSEDYDNAVSSRLASGASASNISGTSLSITCNITGATVGQNSMALASW